MEGIEGRGAKEAIKHVKNIENRWTRTGLMLTVGLVRLSFLRGSTMTAGSDAAPGGEDYSGLRYGSSEERMVAAC